MKIIDKIGPDKSVYVCEQKDGVRLVAVFGCKDNFEIGDEIIVNSAFTIVCVEQIHVEIHGFIYEHTDKNNVRQNVLITYSHLLPQKRHQVVFNGDILQKQDDKLMKTYKEQIEILVKDLVKDESYLVKKTENYI